MNDEFICECLTYAPLVQHVYPRVAASRRTPAIFFCSCGNYSFRLVFAFFVFDNLGQCWYEQKHWRDGGRPQIDKV